MINKICLFIFFASFGISNLSYSQRICGTDDLNLIKTRLLANINALNSNPQAGTRGAIKYIPAKFHLVADSDGKGRVREDKVLEMLCALNEKYLDMNMQFYIKDGFDYINNTSVYNDPKSVSGEIAMQNKVDKKAINIFLNNNAGDNGTGGTVLGYFDPAADWLVIIRSQVSRANASTIEHEMGHFFSMLHSFNGWDGEPYDATKHGTQVGYSSPLGVPNENQDGSNCTTAGDYICDTPPDYNFGYGANGCTFTKTVKDYKGVVVHPMLNNMMGYFIGCSDYEFTPMQKLIIQQDYNTNSHRAYIRTNYVPNTTPLAVPVIAVPANNEIVETYNNVVLQWGPTQTGVSYIVTLAYQIDKNTILKTVITDQNEVTFTDLQKSRKYYWTVKAYGEFAPCESAVGSNFETGALVSTNNPDAANSDIKLQSNLLANGSGLTVINQGEKNVQGNLYIYNISGQKLFRQNNVTLSSGTPYLVNGSEPLAPGQYWLIIDGKESTKRLKFVIAN